VTDTPERFKKANTHPRDTGEITGQSAKFIKQWNDFDEKGDLKNQRTETRQGVGLFFPQRNGNGKHAGPKKDRIPHDDPNANPESSNANNSVQIERKMDR